MSYGGSCDRCRNSVDSWCHSQQLLSKLYRNNIELLAAMFKDSIIAVFSCGNPKFGYVVNFELAPFFQSFLVGLNDASHPIFCFDESYNCYEERTYGHMHMQYWDNTAVVFTQYSSSEFLEKASAKRFSWSLNLVQGISREAILSKYWFSFVFLIMLK